MSLGDWLITTGILDHPACFFLAQANKDLTNKLEVNKRLAYAHEAREFIAENVGTGTGLWLPV